jgi:hypothetical protein
MTDQQQPIQQQAEKHMAALEGWLAPFFAKAPQLSPPLKEELQLPPMLGTTV